MLWLLELWRGELKRLPVGIVTVLNVFFGPQWSCTSLLVIVLVSLTKDLIRCGNLTNGSAVYSTSEFAFLHGCHFFDAQMYVLDQSIRIIIDLATFLVYTNSLFAMYDPPLNSSSRKLTYYRLHNLRRHINTDNTDDFEEFNRPPSCIVFRDPLTSIPSIRARSTRRTTTNIDTSFANTTRRSHRIIIPSGDKPGLSDSESSDGDIEAQKKHAAMQAGSDSDAKNLYSPYYSPLETRKRINTMMFKVQEPEMIGEAGGSWIDFWRGECRVRLVPSWDGWLTWNSPEKAVVWVACRPKIVIMNFLGPWASFMTLYIP